MRRPISSARPSVITATSGVAVAPALDHHAGPDGPIHCNEVLLIGRVSAVLEPRQLPSGDVLARFRLVVARPAAARGPGEHGARVDVLDCQASRAGLRRTVARLQPGEAVEVHGALRRRFFQAVGRPASRHEIEISAMRRLGHPAGRREAGSGQPSREVPRTAAAARG